MKRETHGDVVVGGVRGRPGASEPRRPRARRGLGVISGRQLRKLLDLGERQLSRLLAGVIGVRRDAGGRNPRAPIEEVLKELHRRAGGRRDPAEGELFDPDTDFSEKLKEEQYKAKKRENELAAREQIPREKVLESLREGSVRLQQRLDAIATAFGPDCARAINDAIDELKKEWKKREDAMLNPEQSTQGGA